MMAPLIPDLGSILTATLKKYDVAMETRLPAGYTYESLRTLETISLSFSAASVFAALVAFYWFVRMRRGFRQDLIMLLIQSDMFKAFWLMICPIVYFARGLDDKNNELFCQISAFFLTAAIEAADIAVLMIAMHTALFILKPQRSGGETGLYPYRKYAYAAWVIIPCTMAAVVPITGGRFVDTGAHCYLPTRPMWYRAVLSWIPRYIVFAVIIVTYTWTYFFIALRFKRLQNDQRRASTQINSSSVSSRTRVRQLSRDLPTSPSPLQQGVSDSASRWNSISGARGRQQSITSTISTLKVDESISAPPSRRQQQEPSQNLEVPWNWQDMSYDGPSRPSLPRGSLTRSISPTTASFDQLNIEFEDIPVPEPVRHNTFHSPHNPPTRRRFWRRALSLDTALTRSTSNIGSFLCRGPTRSRDSNHGRSSSLSAYLVESAAGSGLGTSRGRTRRRQLRLLFVYPLIYIVMWIVPFVSHVYRYNDEEDDEQPFPLLVASVSSLCIGAAVDCCFFIAWERPWRSVKSGFWEGLTSRLRMRWQHSHNQGRTREEQTRDARNALERRVKERVQWRANAALNRSRPSRPAREWWDVIEEDEDDQTNGGHE